MKSLVYYLLLPFIYLLVLVPFPVYYLFSDLLFLILYKMLGYRRRVVMTNLRNSFPQKPDAELKAIERSYYRYLCDLMLETLKTLVISPKGAKERCRITPEAARLFDSYHEQGRSIIIVMGHYGNWEWGGNSFSLTRRHQLYVIFHPLSNPHFNSLMYGMRTRFGTRLIDMKEVYKEMVRNKDHISATAFIADQTPAPGSAYWMNFMNQDTPVFQGTEKIARKMNYPVVYVSLKRTSRGHYDLYAETLFEHPRDTADGEITEAHTRRLEADIRQQPETWLWSHRRWKHKRPAATAS